MLKEILSLNKKKLFRKLKNIDPKNTTTGDGFIFITPETNKTLKPCIVSHIDTVFDEEMSIKNHKETKEIYHDKEAQVMWSPQGLGADDRAGVYACLKIWNEMKEKPYMLFTDYEEIGCLGAEEFAIEHHDIITENISCFIEIDRRGKNDAVFYLDEPKDFQRIFYEHGFKKAVGSFSDIKRMGKITGVCGVNISAGYYNEHSSTEYLKVNELELNITRIVELLKEEDNLWCEKWRMDIQQSMYTQYDFDYIDYYPELASKYYHICENCKQCLEIDIWEYDDGICPACLADMRTSYTCEQQCTECYSIVTAVRDDDLKTLSSCPNCSSELI